MRATLLLLTVLALACGPADTESSPGSDTSSDGDADAGQDAIDSAAGSDCCSDTSSGGDAAVGQDAIDSAAGSDCCSHNTALAALLPADATTCTAVAIGKDLALYGSQAEESYSCAVAHFKQGKPFSASFQRHGTDSYLWTTLASPQPGKLFVITSDSFGCPLQLGGGLDSSTAVSTQQCLGAAAASGYGKDWLTCTQLLAAGHGCGKPAVSEAAGNGPVTVLRVIEGFNQLWVPAVPVVWNNLTVKKSWGPCPPSSVCVESWKLAPSGQLTHVKDNYDQPAVTMDGQKLAQVKDIVEGPAFLAQMKQGFGCAPVVDLSIHLVFTAASAEFDQDVTGCVLGSGQGVAEKVHALLTGP